MAAGGERRFAGIDVADVYGAGSTGYRVLGNGAGGGAGDNGLVVCSCDVDGDILPGAVGGGDGDGVGGGIALSQGLDIGIAVIQGICPLAVCADTETAERAAVGAGREAGLAAVRVGDGKGAGDLGLGILGDAAAGGAGNSCLVVDRRHIDGGGGRGDAAVAIDHVVGQLQFAVEVGVGMDGPGTVGVDGDG